MNCKYCNQAELTGYFEFDGKLKPLIPACHSCFEKFLDWVHADIEINKRMLTSLLRDIQLEGEAH
jgi:hypothetical protein